MADAFPGRGKRRCGGAERAARQAVLNGDLLIVPGGSHVRQMKTCGRQTAAGFDVPHGACHGYSQRRYGRLAGRSCPAAGGPRVRDLAI